MSSFSDIVCFMREALFWSFEIDFMKAEVTQQRELSW